MFGLCAFFVRENCNVGACSRGVKKACLHVLTQIRQRTDFQRQCTLESIVIHGKEFKIVQIRDFCWKCPRELVVSYIQRDCNQKFGAIWLGKG